MSRARMILRVLTVLVAIPFFYLVFGLVGALIPGPTAPLPQGPGAVQVGLARGPIHYDFLLPLDPATRARFAFAEEQGVALSNPAARWLILGWGAREFYTRTATLTDISLGPLAHAVTGDSAVLRLDLAGDVTGVDGVVFLTLSAAQYEALLQAIEGDFLRETSGLPRPVATPGLGLRDAFFAARGRFNLFYTCNAWIGTRLRSAGVSFGLWTPTPQAVDLALWWNGLAARR